MTLLTVNWSFNKTICVIIHFSLHCKKKKVHSCYCVSEKCVNGHRHFYITAKHQIKYKLNVYKYIVTLWQETCLF